MFNRLIFIAICCLLFWLPIPLGSYRPWAIMFFGALVSLVFIAHLGLSLAKNAPLIAFKKAKYILTPLLAVCMLLLLQLFNTPLASIDPNQTKVMLLKTITMVMLVALLTSYVTTSSRVKNVVFVLVAAGVFQALYASYLNLTPNATSLVFGYEHSDRARGSFTYQNFLANYLALTLAIGIGLLVSELKLASNNLTFKQVLRDLTATMLSTKMLLRISLILMIIGLILTRSRMGNSAFFIALAAISLFAFFFYNKRPKYLRLLIVSFFVVDLILIGAMFGVEKVKQRLVETSLQSETRDEVVRDSLTLITEKPLFGHGGGSFYTAFPRVKPEPYSGFYDNAHNDYVQFTVELGIVGTAILGFLLLYCLFICAKLMIKRYTPLHQGIAFGGAIAIVHMLLHSTVDYSLQAGANSLTFITIITLVFIVNAMPERKRKRLY